MIENCRSIMFLVVSFLNEDNAIFSLRIFKSVRVLQ
jgi:hypothetical protein